MDNYYPPNSWYEPYAEEQHGNDPEYIEFIKEVNEMVTELVIMLEDPSKPAEGKVIVAKRFLDEWAKDQL